MVSVSSLSRIDLSLGRIDADPRPEVAGSCGDGPYERMEANTPEKGDLVTALKCAIDSGESPSSKVWPAACCCRTSPCCCCQILKRMKYRHLQRLLFKAHDLRRPHRTYAVGHCAHSPFSTCIVSLLTGSLSAQVGLPQKDISMACDKQELVEIAQEVIQPVHSE